MAKIMASYRVFVPVSWWVLMFFIPIGFFVVSLPFSQPPSLVNGLIWFSYMLVFEILMDYWLFGGLLSREASGMDMFKTSQKGIALLHKAVMGDCLRRLIYLLVYGLVWFALTGERQCFVSALAVYAVATAVLNLTRHVLVFQLHMTFGLAAMLPYLAIALPAMYLEKSAAVWLAELAAAILLAAGVSVFTVWHVGYCVKGSYYER
ncbi:MAG: hypothetical protein NC180_01960 [Muribaculaceae bacterium]|nr:hypothetical protein [Roseburia sp.]MCM1430707.1 hypothetical protein [Muribaculaceae bacterium]MCM1491974.1 hypothetical protein [Muribaculaceae bacterium]